MKKLIYIILLCACSLSAQETNLTYIMSPGSLEDGYSFGLQFEGQNRTVYYGTELYSFPNLHDLPYHHLIGRFGFNKHFSKDGKNNAHRFFLGGRAGGIHRNGEGIHVMVGVEAGVDIYIPKTPVFFRAAVVTDCKTDSTIWSRKPHHTVNSVIMGIGVNF